MVLNPGWQSTQFGQVRIRRSRTVVFVVVERAASFQGLFIDDILLQVRNSLLLRLVESHFVDALESVLSGRR